MPRSKKPSQPARKKSGPAAVSRADFHRFVKLQKSAVVNMADLRAVCQRTSLSEATVRLIYQHYEALDRKYPYPKA